MKQMSLIEMDGFLKGKCIPRDLKVNETNAEYLVRKFGELESKIALLEVQLKLSEAAERAWESSMMQACGEDGPKSVADKFAELEAKCAALAVENAWLKGAFDKPQAYLSWHAIPPTWEDPLPCGEYLDVHDEAGHKNSDGTDCWPVYAKPEIETPATDAFLAEVRESAIPDEATERDLFEEWVMEKIFISKTTLEGLRTDDGYRNSTLSGTDYNGMWSQWKAIRAAQLRQEAQ
ncbi:hypothetical protein [Escherichia coli]|uniref:hypothetical protein n=1 Tax=Escherichia coli TaxID=562 RepID=UPI002340108C|nr:hypothetical protein [Escherichia coli]